jgi:hypothetical protein
MSKILEQTLANLKNWALSEEERLKIAEALERQEELRKLLQPVTPFKGKDLTQKAKDERLKKASEDFWFFDKTYFPPEIYEAYAEPSFFHKDLIKISQLTDKKAHIIHGMRDGGKTITMKKAMIWSFLFGKRSLMAVASQTLTTPHAFILDLIYLIDTNERICFDFSDQDGNSDLIWMEKSTERIYAKSKWNPKGTFIATLSEGRSARGLQRMLERPDFIYVTDFENLESSFTTEAIDKRIDRLNEMRTTLSQSGTLLWEGNNFDVECAMNRIRVDHDRGLLTEEYVFHLYSAWDDKRRPKNLWPAKYPAKTIEEMKALVKPKDDYDWLGNYQGTPETRSGDRFPKSLFNTFKLKDIPKDIVAVSWTDPNLSLKSKGDTTAMCILGFSPSTQLFYIPAVRCRSYDKSNDLLRDNLELFYSQKDIQVVALGMDGNVSQESVWTNNIANFTLLSGFPFPHVVFKRYVVDNLVTNIEDKYKQGHVLFEENIVNTEEGKEFLKQFFRFRTKKAGRKDDAPDSVVCAYTLLIEMGFGYLIDSSKPIFGFVKRKTNRI